MLCCYGANREKYRRFFRLEDHNKMDLEEIGVNVMNWMEFVNVVLNLQVT